MLRVFQQLTTIPNWGLITYFIRCNPMCRYLRSPLPWPVQRVRDEQLIKRKGGAAQGEGIVWWAWMMDKEWAMAICNRCRSEVRRKER